jgi:Ca2+/H+ antiporter, TMEM165/GDT1 family
MGSTIEPADRTSRASVSGASLNLSRVTFGFIIILACTLNFGFFVGAIDRPEFHHPAALFAAVIVNLIATGFRLGDRTQVGATHVATSLVATLQLLAAATVWAWRTFVVEAPVDSTLMVTVVSLAGGALLANLFSVILLLGETLRHGR